MKHGKRNDSGIGIVEAVETLSSIADLDVDAEIAIAKDRDLVLQGELAHYHTVHWFAESDPGHTVKLVQDTFRVVLRYLQNFYEEEYEHLHKPETIEEIKTIMVLVGEAAQKLDKFTSVFKKTKFHSVTDLTEYRKLQKFYHSKISKRIDQGFVSRWLKSLPQKVDDRVSNIKLRGRKKVSSGHVFVDLDAVKRDVEYELFFIRKENGTRYFNPRLIRNIKLVCDFGEYFDGPCGEDRLQDVNLWIDKVMHISSKELIQYCGNTIANYFQESNKHKHERLGELLRKSCLALMLSGNSRNLLSQNPVKSCHQYFMDFQHFLREAMQTRSYQKMLAYPPTRSSTYRWSQMELTQTLCCGIYSSLQGLQDLEPLIQEFIDDGVERLKKKKRHPKVQGPCNGVANQIATHDAAVSEVLKSHPQGPLMKVLDLMQEFGNHTFDTLTQYNLPSFDYELSTQRHKISNLRIPSPTIQEFIHRAKVNPEFRGFLRAYSSTHHKKHHLLINLQDRTSWREHIRSVVLEDLGKHKDFKEVLTVVTLTKDTDFYHQLDPYHNINHSKDFVCQFKEHLRDKQGGFSFSTKMYKTITKDWADGVLDTIHEVFFDGKNVISRQARLDFIEIFYMLLQLKLIESTGASSFSLTCKDGVDTGTTASVGLFLFLGLINGRPITEKQMQRIDLILFTPALMNRERNVQADRVSRMVNVIGRLESCIKNRDEAFMKELYKAFRPFYAGPILKSKAA